MGASLRLFLSYCLVVPAALLVSSVILALNSAYSLNMFWITLAPLIGGFWAGFLVIFFMEDGGLLLLLETFWYIPLTGTAVSLLTVVFIITWSQHYALFL